MASIFCPSCKRLNESGATNCVFCNALIEPNSETHHTTILGETDPDILLQEIESTFIRRLKVPDQGIGIFSNNDPSPIAVQDSQEFILGRKSTEVPLQNVIDLAPFGGFEEGVSQKHALIRRTASGYEILDLGSTNGTWLNKKRLVPHLAYPMDSGAQINLGRLSLFLLYK